MNAERANALGGKRTNFYAQAARGTSSEMRPNGFAVSVNQVGIRQRFFGGTITPKGGKKYLTIPMRAEAYGRRARDFNNLRFAMVPGIGPALVEANATLIRRTKKGFVPASRGGSGYTHLFGEMEGVKASSVSGGDYGNTGGGVMYRLVRKVQQRPDPSVLPSREALISGITIAGKSYMDRLTQRR